jgi:serine/threonine protein kinase
MSTGSPAQSMTGHVLEGGWVVGERIDPSAGTGGCFSVRYSVTNASGQRAFLKALDISAPLKRTPDLVTALKELLEDYELERRVVEKCAKASRIVRGLAHGQADVAGSAIGPVPYLVFEYADGGDVRRHLGSLAWDVETAWKLETLHHVAVGLMQLHKLDIVHQDLKPSNVLVFPDVRKIGDMGSASDRSSPRRRDGDAIAGDPMYPPLEVFYGYRSPEWDYRLGYDLYLLGSMIAYFFTQEAMSALLAQHLDETFYPAKWTGTFDEVLPYLQNAFAAAIESIRQHIEDAEIATEVASLLRELCNPDPSRRGLRQSGATARSRFSLDYYVSRLDRLAKLATYKGKKR